MAACRSPPSLGTTSVSKAKIRTGSASNSTSYFLFFTTINNPQGFRASRFTTCSVEASSSSSSSSSSCSSCSTSHSNSLIRVKSNNKSLQESKTCDGLIVSVAYHGEAIEELVEEKAKTGTLISSRRNDHAVSIAKVKKRPFWKKIFFASNKMKSILLLNIITVVYASNIPVVKEVESMMDPAAFSAVRFIMSAIPFLPFVFRARDDVETRNAGIELGFWVSLGYLVEALGLLTSEAGRASFISLFTVIVVPLLDGMLGAIIPARTWFGVLMSTIGVAMLECSGSPPNVGDLLNFLSAIFFGIHMLRTEHFSRKTKKENFLPLLGYEVCVVAFLSTIWVMIGGWFDGVEEVEQSSWTWPVVWDWIIAFPWIPALYTGAFSTGLCLWVEIAAMRDVSATETAIIYGMEPLWGAGFAWFLLGERWGTSGWIGAALVLGGSLMVQIFGTSAPDNKSLKVEENIQKGDLLSSRDKQKLQRSLSASPVVVRSSKDIIDMLK